jgi:hypothetical protein
VRLAIEATPGASARSVLQEGFVVPSIGLAIGLPIKLLSFLEVGRK